MPEYVFKIPDGAEFKIVGDLLKQTTIDSKGGGLANEYGPKTTVKIYKTQNHGFLATVEYHPGVAEQKKGDAWAGFIPDPQRPKATSLDELRIEIQSASLIETFPSMVIETHVKEAVERLIPPPGPTVID